MTADLGPWATRLADMIGLRSHAIWKEARRLAIAGTDLQRGKVAA